MQNVALKDKKKNLRKEINGKFDITDTADENKRKKMSLLQFLPLSEAETRVSFIQLKPILGIFLFGFSLSIYPQHSLKALWLELFLLLNPVCPLKYVPNCEHNFSFLYFDPALLSRIVWVHCIYEEVM
jgi:hypothetical protein